MGNSLFNPRDSIEGLEGIQAAQVDDLPDQPFYVQNADIYSRGFSRPRVVPLNSMSMRALELPFGVSPEGFELKLGCDESPGPVLCAKIECKAPTEVQLFLGATVAYDASRNVTSPTPQLLHHLSGPYRFDATQESWPLPHLTELPKDIQRVVLAHKVGEADDGMGLWLRLTATGSDLVYWCVLNFSPPETMPSTERPSVHASIRQAWVQDGETVFRLKTVYGAASQDNDDQCCVCLSETRNVMVMPCSHICLCHNCARLTIAELGACPLCRETPTALIRIDLDKGQETNADEV